MFSIKCSFKNVICCEQGYVAQTALEEGYVVLTALEDGYVVLTALEDSYVVLTALEVLKTCEKLFDCIGQSQNYFLCFLNENVQ